MHNFTESVITLEWRHNGHDDVSNHQPHDFYSTVYSDADQRKHQSSASLAFVPVFSEFPSQSASNAENVSIWWRHHARVPRHERQARTCPQPCAYLDSGTSENAAVTDTIRISIAVTQCISNGVTKALCWAINMISDATNKQCETGDHEWTWHPGDIAGTNTCIIYYWYNFIHPHPHPSDQNEHSWSCPFSQKEHFFSISGANSQNQIKGTFFRPKITTFEKKQ